MEFSTNDKIKILLNKRGLTYKDLADKLGTTRQNLYNILNRGDLKESQLKKIATALDCSVESIFTLNDTKESL